MSFVFLAWVMVGEISKEGIEKIRHAVEARNIADSWESGKYYYDDLGTTEVMITGVKVPEKPVSDEFLILNRERNKWIKYEDAKKEDLEMYEQEYKRYFQGDIPEEKSLPLEDPIEVAKEEIKKATQNLIAQKSKEAIKAQQEVIKALDEIIKNKTKNNNSNKNNSNSNSSANGSSTSSSNVANSGSGNQSSDNISSGNPQPVDTKGFRDNLANKLWGQLKNRNEDLNSKNVITEDYLPFYRKDIENYFKNLAEDTKFK